MHAQEQTEKAGGTGRALPLRSAAGPAAASPVAVPGSAQSLLALQRTAGNAAVAHLVQAQRSAQAQRAAEEEQHAHGAGCGHDRPQVQRSSVGDVISSPGRALDEPVRTEMEARLGEPLSDVRVHTGLAAQRSAQELEARAYTVANHVVIGQGGADKHTLAHELTHVIQQRNGPVAGTDNGGGVSVSDPSDRFERAAEANATRVMQGPVPVQRAAEEGAATRADDPGTMAVQRVNYSATTASNLHESDSDYSSEDNLTAHQSSLPAATSEGEVAHAVATGANVNVTLYRGALMEDINAMVAHGSAGGRSADANTAAPSQRQAADQVHNGRRHPEFSTDQYISRQFSRRGGRGVVVVMINTYYLTKGSVSEDGWVALASAPVTVLHVVDRSHGRPAATGAGANAS